MTRGYRLAVLSKGAMDLEVITGLHTSKCVSDTMPPWISGLCHRRVLTRITLITSTLEAVASYPPHPFIFSLKCTSEASFFFLIFQGKNSPDKPGGV